MVIAIVSRTVQGKHGPYAVAKSEGLKGSITFSLEEPVWPEKDFPEPGHVVVLEEIRKKVAGWRARKARFWRPEDEREEMAFSGKKRGENSFLDQGVR